MATLTLKPELQKQRMHLTKKRTYAPFKCFKRKRFRNSQNICNQDDERTQCNKYITLQGLLNYQYNILFLVCRLKEALCSLKYNYERWRRHLQWMHYLSNLASKEETVKPHPREDQKIKLWIINQTSRTETEQKRNRHQPRTSNESTLLFRPWQ